LNKPSLKIIITTDVHGNIADEPALGRIGYARLKAWREAAEKAGHTVFLLDAGDVFSGSAYTEVDQGCSVAKLLGLLGYRLLTPGNHDFDYNESAGNPLYYSEVLVETVRRAGNCPVDVVAQNLSRNGQTIYGLTRNPVIIFDETDKYPDGRRVIVTGVVSPYTLRPSLRGSLPGYEFGLLETASETKEKILSDLSASLKQFDRPGDVVLVLSHLGYPDPEGVPAQVALDHVAIAQAEHDELYGSDLATVPNVDFVVDGHSHTTVSPKKIGQAWYANGGRYLENFLEITLDDKGQRTMVHRNYGQTADLIPDCDIEAYLRELEKRHGLNDIILVNPDPELFSLADLKTDNMALGRLICSIMMQATGAELALHTVGGIRAGLSAGPIRVRDFYDVLPFKDELVTVTLSGHELVALLNRGSGCGGHGILQFYGFSAYAWPKPNGGLKVEGLRMDNGLPVDLAKNYRAAINGFLAKNMTKPTENHGDLVQALRLGLESNFNIENLRLNRRLFVFSDPAEARTAWEKSLK
jgi:2',3'-cyclic-nucleotide 2'-phosphodiesterase (5'-nucleotidase family)